MKDTQLVAGLTSHLTHELEPEAVVIAKEYLDAMRSGQLLPYNPEYVLMRLMVDLHGYVPPEPPSVFGGVDPFEMDLLTKV